MVQHANERPGPGGGATPEDDRPVPESSLHEPVLRWYADHQRDLPWRRPEASAWSVLVSELMLQQTPVARVLPVHEAWLERWPTPADLAAEPTGEAVRAWGRLGYPRRALRLHGAAVAIVERHDGVVPDAYDDLIDLPGVGDYTAAAVASFAYGRRHVVLDTNVRRVLARAVAGVELPGPSVTRAERDRATQLLPDDEATAATWAVAVMELGALVCAAAAPRCPDCPIADRCAWRAAGSPAYDGPPRRAQAWAGTDRQCRGRLLAVLRDSDGPVHRTSLDAAWHDEPQTARCLAGLVADALVARVGPDSYALP
jgi:A/G-specific adenine glycosylase